MADRFPGEIHIGGPIFKKFLGKLIGMIVAEGVSLEDYSGPVTTMETLRRVFAEGKVVDLFHEQARYGQFDELEAFLAKHHIHFDRHSDGRYEYDAEKVFYRGGKKPVVFPAGQSGTVLLRRDEVMRILDDAKLNDQKKVKAIRGLACPPEMTPLTPVQIVCSLSQKGGDRRCPRRRK
jgi:hypothetical protein